MAMCDAKALYEAVESGKHVDQRCILQLLGRRSRDQTKAVLASYRRLYGLEFARFLKQDKCGEFGRLVRAVVRCVQSPEKHFAKRLRAALKSGGAREALVRTVVTRAGVDVRRVNQEFAGKTGWTLESLVRNEFAGKANDDGLVGDLLVELIKQAET